MIQSKKYERRKKEDKPVLAICYDFDKTLTPDDMQAQGYIQSVGFEVSDFWAEANGFAEEMDMDYILASMFKMKEKAKGQVVFTREKLQEYGSKINLFPGVEEWFERIRTYGEENQVIVEHYIISCGMKEMIEGTDIAKKGVFEKIYASSFYYDQYGVAVWPAQVVNYTSKTQFLARIQKGVLEVNDFGVNDSFPPEKIRVPFRNMIYIGDSDTDIPCMKMVNVSGGHSIGVFDSQTMDKTKVHKMLRENRIKYFTPADYTDGSQLDTLVKGIIQRTAANETLENHHFQCKTDSILLGQDKLEACHRKTDLIHDLEHGKSFASIHAIVKNLDEFEDWTPEEVDKLLWIATNIKQVGHILQDHDVKVFYQKLLDRLDHNSSCAVALTKILEV